MQKIRLGKTNMMVTKLGFGGIPIQRLTEPGAIEVVRRCLDLGINFIDTAHIYSNSEERIGKAIDGRRGEVILATKTMERTRRGVEDDIKLSLERLGTDYIDLYQFHNVCDSDTLNRILEPGGPMSVVEAAHKAGVIRHIGISSHVMDMAKELVKTGRFETIMFPFNFITNEAAAELLPLTREHDVGLIAMKPLAGGVLENITLAFKYLFQFPDVVPIPGIGAVHEVEEIVEILEAGAMTADERKEMERIRREMGKQFCRRCEYCQPCPEGIVIPLVMDAYGFIKKEPLDTVFSGFFADEMEKAALCTRCGECEEKCPYDLPIRDMIAERVAYYQEEKKKYLG